MLKKLQTKFALWWFTGLLKEDIQNLETILKIKGNTIPGRPPAEFTQEFLEDIERCGLTKHKLAKEFFATKKRQNELSNLVSEQVQENARKKKQEQMKKLPKRIEALEEELAEVKKMLEKEMI